MKISDGGTYTLIQDYPGRQGSDRWRVGIPPAGPMDSYSFRIANRLVGNDESAAALEITIGGPTVTFSEDTIVAITGAPIEAEVDGKPVPGWTSFKVQKGSTLRVSNLTGEGVRSYLAVSGGIDVPDYLGSKSSFPLGKLGGTGEGAPLKADEQLPVGTPSSKPPSKSVPSSMIPSYTNTWEVDALVGPQEAPDYVTDEDLSAIFNSTYEVSHNANRLGVRLIGPKPKFARTDGGEGGSHPSNLNDNPYAIGAMNFTGDNPVILTVDGPSLGGFICPITIPSYDLWKIGQARPGSSIKFRRVSMEYAVAARKQQDEAIKSLKAPSFTPPITKKPTEKALVHERKASGDKFKVQYRIAGDRFLLVEYGEAHMDINYRVRVHQLETFLVNHKPAGLIDTIPGVRTLLIWYDNMKISLQDLLKLLNDAEDHLPGSDNVVLKSRIFNLPLAFNDKWNRQAIDRYMNTIRPSAQYLPSNVEFIARNNGLEGGVDAVEKVVMDASYMVLGLGDVYLGAPCAVPIDPRHRLSVPKYNPARTFTPEGAVGIGGMYMCIYPMESPGGYQLIGRTLPIWNTKGNLPNFDSSKPWLLDMFDQVRFKKVGEDELEDLRAQFASGKFVLDVKEEELDMKKYNEFLRSIQSDTDKVKEKQKIAQEHLAKLEKVEEKKNTERKGDVDKILAYLADMVVNGPDHPGAVGAPPSKEKPVLTLPSASAEFPSGHLRSTQTPPPGLKNIFDAEGPEGFVKAVLAKKGALLTDTTWRDAHQSLLMTRMRTADLVNVARTSSQVFSNLYSIEMWGGATFDVALRFLHECPWDRLATLRALVPNVPFQMLFRGANAVGYSSYPDNVVYKFCKQAKDTGIDVFRIFDSLNYLENMKLGIDAVGEAGGIIEATICYTGDVSNPQETKYPLEYYLKQARELVKLGIHVLCIKDMAGLLKPHAATLLISALRKEFPLLPIHVHSHDTAGTAVASMINCINAGANAVDCCNDALSGLTSQASMGAILANFQHTEKNAGVDLDDYLALTTYWEAVRRTYAPFESGQKSAGADVYKNQIPGGQYTNLYFQALSMGLSKDWDLIKHAYADANAMLGDIVKVTPSSKVVGDLASFMVTNKLSKEDTLSQAKELNFPKSVIEFLQGYLGHPPGGFPEPFRSDVVKGAKMVEGRPGADMPPFDFPACHSSLEAKWKTPLREVDVMSHIQFPDVFADYMNHQSKFGKVTNLPTPQFLAPMAVGEKISFSLEDHQVSLALESVGEIVDGHCKVSYEVNGQKQQVNVKAKSTSLPPFILREGGGSKTVDTGDKREKANPNNPGSVGATLPGKVLEVVGKVGQTVEKGVPVVVLSSMKLQLTITAPKKGQIVSVRVAEGDSVSVGDLLFEIN